MLGIALCATALGPGAPASQAAVVEIPGSKIRIFASTQGALGVRSVADDRSYFRLASPSDQTGTAGLVIFGNRPDIGPAGAGFLPFYPPSGDPPSVTGAGTASNPYRLTMQFADSVSTPYFEITQTITHVNGSQQFEAAYEVVGTDPGGSTFLAYVVGLLAFESGTASFAQSPLRNLTVAGADERSVSLVATGPPEEGAFSSYAAGGDDPDPLFPGENSVVGALPRIGYDYAYLSPQEQIPSAPFTNPGMGVVWSNWNPVSGDDPGLPYPETARFEVTWRFGSGGTPERGKTAVVEPVSGTVKIKVPGSDQFVELDGEIPVGSTVDTRKGKVRLTTAKDDEGNTQSADFKDGLFKLLQGGKSAQTILELTGPKQCKATRSAAVARGSATFTARKKRGRGRTLWGSGKGKFSSKGSRGSGSVRGTTWRVTDRCDGTTLIQSISGKVLAKDTFGKKTGKRLLTSGKKFVAK